MVNAPITTSHVRKEDCHLNLELTVVKTQGLRMTVCVYLLKKSWSRSGLFRRSVYRARLYARRLFKKWMYSTRLY